MTSKAIFTPTSAILEGTEYKASYSIGNTGKIFVFLTYDESKTRITIGTRDEFYTEALEAAQAARDIKEAAKAAAPKPEPRPASGPKVDKLWLGSTLNGKGWKIELGGAYDKIRVIFTKRPTEEAKTLVKAHGFYYSPAYKSWNRGTTCKGFRAAQALAAALNAA